MSFTKDLRKAKNRYFSHCPTLFIYIACRPAISHISSTTLRLVPFHGTIAALAGEVVELA